MTGRMERMKLVFLLMCLPALVFSQSTGVTGDSTMNKCETKTYTISILNNSGNALTSLEITNDLGLFTGFSYETGTSSIDVNGGPAFCTNDPVPSGDDLIWNIDTLCSTTFTLNNGDTLNISFDLTTGCDAVSGSMNVTVDYLISGTPAQDFTNFSIEVLPGGVTIKKTPNVIPQFVGQDVTWTLTVENTGLGVIENVVVTDVLGAGLAYVSSAPAGNNAGQTTSWSPSEIAVFNSMNPGDIVTMDITATVIACENLDNVADVRWGCDMVTDCFNTDGDGGTATASVQRNPRTPLVEYTPDDISFTYCDDTVGDAFTISNTGDGTAYDVWIVVDFDALDNVTVSNVSAGAVYNAAQNRFELTNPLPPGGTYDLSYQLTFSSWCAGTFPSGDLLWQTQYNDECNNPFYPPVQFSTLSAPAGTPSLAVSKDGAPSAIQIGSQVTYNISSSYSGPLSCGASGSVGMVTVVDTVPDGFTVANSGGGTWVSGGGGTGGTITWTYMPPASLNTSIILQAPDAGQCDTYCFTYFTNTIEATGTDCCGCPLSASDSQLSAIECEEMVDSNKTANPVTAERCTNIQYTNTYDFTASAAMNLDTLVFEEHADSMQQYVPGSLSVTYDGLGDITGCVAVTDNTPGGRLRLDFSGCAADPVASKNLTITYQLTVTTNTAPACTGSSFYSWSSLDLGTSGSQCLQDGIIQETTVVNVQAPAMTVSVSGLGRIVNTCETQTITLVLAQTSSLANPKDVRLVLSGLNYYVVNPGATVCGGSVAPTACTPAIVGDDYIWYFADGFTGNGQNATLQLDVQKRCTGSGDLVATAYFDDNCNDDATYDDTCSVTATETPALLVSGDLLIEKTPEVYYAAENTIQWKIYITNRGTGTAHNVWMDDELGAGLDYVSAVVDDGSASVTDDQDHEANAVNGCTVSIPDMAPGERREVTFNAVLIDCNNLTNDVSASWGCVGVNCQTEVTDSATVEIPAPLLVNTNVVVTPIDVCSSPGGTITIRNAGQTTCYNLIITETLPAGLEYIPGTTRWRLNGGGWNGPNPAYDPNPSVSPLQWTSTEIAALASIDPGDTIEIDFDFTADCPFSGGQVTVSTQYENPCGNVFNTADSNFALQLREPQITVTKTRVNEPIDCGDLVEWTITVQNTSGYTLPIIWVEDTLGAAFTFVSSVGDPPFTADNGTYDGTSIVSWELRNVNHNDVVTLTIRATSDTSPCSPDLDNTVDAWWGCGAADGSSATRPGTDPPDDNLCLTNTSIVTTNTPTREPAVGFLNIVVNPVSLNACDDNTQLTVTIENTGPTDASDVDLVITLPPGISYNTGSSTVTCGGVTGPAADPDIAGSVLTFYDITDNAAGKANNICDTVEAAGGNDTLTLVFSVQSNCFVTADMDFDLYYYDCCSDTQYSTGSSETITALYPDISITKTPVASQIACSGQQTWTITVTNNGSGQAQVVRIEDTLGDWIDYIGSTPAATSMGGQVYGWEINNLAASGGSQSFTITGQLNPDGFPNQADCAALLRQNNVRAIWGCGIAGDAVDNDPTTQGYDCTYTSWSNAVAATLQMPDLVVTGITPDITCTADGSVTGSVTVQVQNQGDGNTVNNFTVEITDGNGWTGTGTHSGNIAPGGSVTVTIDTATWVPGCQPCGAPYVFNVTSVDQGNAVCECNEGNNSYGPVNYITPIPDLTVLDIDFTNVSCTNDNISGTVDVVVRNNGCAAAGNFEVSLTTDGCLAFSNETVASLAAETSTTVSFSINGSWPDCTVQNCQFTAEVDSTDAVCECDGTNNDRVETYSTTLPDLIVTDIDFSAITCAADNLSGSVSVTVRNQGYGSAVGFQVSLGTDGCLSFGNQTVLVPLGAGASTTVTFPVTPPWVNCADCDCDFTATVDPTNVICECDGTNNQATETYSGSLPDLRINSVTPAASCVSDGNLTGTVTVNVGNAGCGDANNAVVRLLSTCGVVFADQTVNLTAGSSTDLTFNYTPDCASCTCIFIAIIDPDSLICECSGANNALASAPYTLNVPDITVQSDTLALTCLSDGQVQVSGSVTLANPGCGLLFNATVPMRFTVYDNTGCAGNVIDQWTQNFSPAVIFPGGGTQAFTITPRTIIANMADNSTGCLVSIRVEADYSNTVCECDGTNNTYCADNKNINIPDIEVSGDTLGVSCLGDGQVTISGNVTLANNGCGSNLNTNVPMRFTLYDNTGCAGSQIAQWTQTFSAVNIAAGGGTQVFAMTPRTVTSNMVTNAIGCQVSIRVEADYTNTVCETDGTDNTYCADNKNIDIPDIEMPSDTLSVACLADGQVTVSGTVTLANNGCGSNLNTNVPMRFTLYDNTGCAGSQIAQWTETLAGVNIPALGGTQVFAVTPQNIVFDIVNNSTGCQVSIRMEADYTDTICESDGTDNTLCSNKAVSVPNLTVNSVTPAASCAGDGNIQGSVVVNVGNTGCGAANGAVVRLTSDCGLVFADQTVNLAAGASSDVTFNFTPTAANCTCVFTATIDPADAVCESDGTDNSAASVPNTLDIPDIEVSGDTLGVTCLSDGQVTISGTVTLLNSGCGASLTTDVPMRFTLYDNTGCSGNQLSQWTETFSAVNIASGGGTQAFTVTPRTVNANMADNSTGCRVSIRVEADYSNVICEFDGTNNTWCADNKDIDTPDLQITANTLAITCMDDGRFRIDGNITIANNGCGSDFTAPIPILYTLLDSGDCSGNQVRQFNMQLNGANIPAGGNQSFSVGPIDITEDAVANSTGCEMSVNLELDPAGIICESDGTNNTYCASNLSVPIPNVVVDSDNITITCVSDGQVQFSGTVTLRNDGCAPAVAASSAIRFVGYDDVNCGGNMLINWQEIFTGINIPVGGTQTFTITSIPFTGDMSVNSTDCRISIDIQADATNTICESDGSDNNLCVNKNISIPDLTINNVGTTVTCLGDGSATGTTVNVENTGCGDAANVVVRLVSDCGLTFADQTINLAAGESRDVLFLFTSGITVCSCNFTATIDPDDTICETNGDNNINVSSADMEIPDLEVLSQSMDVACLDDGNIRVTGSVTVINNGCGPDFVDPIPVRYTLYGREGCNGQPLSQWTGRLSGVNLVSAGGTQRFSIPEHEVETDFIDSLDRCRFSVRVQLDYTNSICEWDGTDNTRCSNGRGECIDLLVDEVTSTCQDDGSVDISMTVSNQGNGDVRGVSLRIYDQENQRIYDQSINLSAGTSQDLTFHTKRYAVETPLTFRVVIDEENAVCESSNQNNEITITQYCPYRGTPKLEVEKICPPAQQPGSLLRFEVRLINTGDANIYDVKVEDRYPDYFKYIPGSSVFRGSGIPDPTGVNPLVWNVGTIQQGEQVSLFFYFTVDADIDPGQYCDTVKATGSMLENISSPGLQSQRSSGFRPDDFIVVSDSVECCTTIRREGEGCCLRIRERPMGFRHMPETFISFVEPYFRTGSAMFTTYAAFNLWKNRPLPEGSLSLFMRERLLNYSRSTMEAFYVYSRMGKYDSDGTIWLSYGGAYPQGDDSGWNGKRIDTNMTVSQIGFELMALNEAIRNDSRPEFEDKYRQIIGSKLRFLKSMMDNLPHQWTFRKDEDGKQEIVREKGDASLVDLAALLFSLGELEGNGFDDAVLLKRQIRDRMKKIDNQRFRKNDIEAELLFVMALIQNNEPRLAGLKMERFEKLLDDGDIKLDNLYVHALATLADLRAGGNSVERLYNEMFDTYYHKNSGLLAEQQSDLTLKIDIQSLAPLLMLFNESVAGDKEKVASLLYRMFDETGLFLKKRNLLHGRPLVSLVKNSPFQEDVSPMLSMTKEKTNEIPVFSETAVVHSPRSGSLGDQLFPHLFTKILTPGYLDRSGDISRISYGMIRLGKRMLGMREVFMREEGRSLVSIGNKYLDTLFFSNAGKTKDGLLLIPYDTIAVKGHTDKGLNLQSHRNRQVFSTDVLADYILAETAYIQNRGKYSSGAGALLDAQKKIVGTFEELGYVPVSFRILKKDGHSDYELLPSPERAEKLTVAKLLKATGYGFLGEFLVKHQGSLQPEDLIFLSLSPDLVPVFMKEIGDLTGKVEADIRHHAARVLGNKVLNKDFREPLENLLKLWDEELGFPVSDKIENSKTGFVLHYSPDTLLLYMLAVPSGTDRHFRRTLSLFNYLMENNWGYRRNKDYAALPPESFLLLKETPKSNPEPGDYGSFRVWAENRCDGGVARAVDIPSLFLRATFQPDLIYGGSEHLDNLTVLNPFFWRYENMWEGVNFDYLYQVVIPKNYDGMFLEGQIFATGRNGYESFGPETATGDNCIDFDRIGKLPINPLHEVYGVVFEDLNANGKKDGSEKGIPGIRFRGTNGRVYLSDNEGQFKVMTGTEQLGIQIDLSSISDHYVLSTGTTMFVDRFFQETVSFGLIPCETVMGHVSLNETDVSGVLIEAGDAEAMTSANGKFIFRNLPVSWKDYIRIADTQPFYKGDIKPLKIEIQK